MNRLLVVAPAFPPHPSPATHRARFLARYAPAAGWSVEVLSVRPELYAEPLDPELERLVPAETKVTRVGALPLRLTRRFGIGDLGLRAYAALRRALSDICRRDPPDALFIPGPPFYPFLLGAAMRREFGVPYVLDFTDPWAFPPMPGQNQPWKKGYWASRVASLLEPIAVRNASHVLAVSDATNDAIRARHPELPPERFSAVPFGFEAADFDALRADARPVRFWDAADGCRHLVYVGVMWPPAYPTLRALFAAVAALREECPALGRTLRLHFFGTTYDAAATQGPVLPIASEFGLTDIVNEHVRRIPYVAALAVLTQADVILALGSDERHYMASKIFPCILARRPLLAVFHEASPVCAVVRDSRAGALVTFDDLRGPQAKAREIREALHALLASQSVHPVTDRLDAMRKYSAAASTAHIVRILDEVVRHSGRAVGRASVEFGHSAALGDA